jgi:hypothetical protein
VRGLPGILALLRLLQSIPQESRHVRVLFIGDAASDRADLVHELGAPGDDHLRARYRSARELIPTTVFGVEFLNYSDPPVAADHSVEGANAYAQIVTYLAPHLEVLTAHVPWIFSQEIHLPCLRDLSLRACPPSSLPCPLLQRLHVACEAPSRTLLLWLQGTPKLECLHLCMVWGDEALPGVVRVLAGMESGELHAGTGPGRSSIQLRCLRTVIVEPETQRSGLGSARNGRMIDDLQNLVADAAGGPIDVVLRLR